MAAATVPWSYRRAQVCVHTPELGTWPLVQAADGAGVAAYPAPGYPAPEQHPMVFSRIDGRFDHVPDGQRLTLPGETGVAVVLERLAAE